MMLIIVL